MLFVCTTDHKTGANIGSRLNQSMANILLVEDDEATLSTVRDCLLNQHHKVETASCVSDAFAFLQTYNFDLLILDWDLGDKTLTGIDILQSFRAKGHASPVLMLTGNSDIQHKEVGFNSGADDYVAKPFDSRELLLRVNALLRRPVVIRSSVLSAGDLRLDVARKQVDCSKGSIQLRRMEFALLEFFLSHQRQVFSCEELLNSVWGSDSESGDLAVRLTVKRLRERLKESLSTDPIETVHGRGYSFYYDGPQPKKTDSDRQF
jgi:DNA-binding response OmpR family regulator